VFAVLIYIFKTFITICTQKRTFFYHGVYDITYIFYIFIFTAIRSSTFTIFLFITARIQYIQRQRSLFFLQLFCVLRTHARTGSFCCSHVHA
jgi:hypothetical protein